MENIKENGEWFLFRGSLLYSVASTVNISGIIVQVNVNQQKHVVCDFTTTKPSGKKKKKKTYHNTKMGLRGPMFLCLKAQ